MIFKTFCEHERIDAAPFLKFILRTYISGWQMLNLTPALEMAWKSYLEWEYWHLYNKLASEDEK